VLKHKSLAPKSLSIAW